MDIFYFEQIQINIHQVGRIYHIDYNILIISHSPNLHNISLILLSLAFVNPWSILIMVKVPLINATIELQEYIKLELVDFLELHLFCFLKIDYELC
jgi:hypothetical protein